MSQHWKSPSVSRVREEMMSPFLTPSQRNISPKSWNSPHQSWQSRNRPASQSHWSPQYYNSSSSPNGQWGSRQQWSPNQWDPASNYHRSWSYSPGTPKYSPFYKNNPECGLVYPEKRAQVHFRRNHKDISHYYSPSMVEDPWAELEAAATGKTVST
ncbi:gastrula-specific protein 17-like [Bufo bufo]|uniref:gastrula-specific protein 17-like n=1 Tax=Bufo bufo TaxID=8384 RepID=UPI001ABEB860|nr:gastrula-specific protein 17-like [Bufo bufo]